VVVSAPPGFLDRAPESYGRIAWAGRLVVRNLQWSRTQGVGRLIEEHELHPVRRAVSAARRAQWRRAHGVTPGEAVAVFLVGMPRSGTNMLVRALAAAPEFEVHNDGDRTAFHRYRLRPDPVVRALVMASRHRFVLVKPLMDSHRAATLLDELGVPTAPRLLWAYRNVDDRARSALVKFGPSASRALQDIAAGTGLQRWQACGLSRHSIELIRRVDWDRASPADGAALLWYVRNRLLFELDLAERPDVLPVSYDTLVRQPAAHTRLVAAFLGAAWQPSMAAAIDGRAVTPRPALPLDPLVRACCENLAHRLDAAASAAAARVAPGVPCAVAGPTTP
jgi:hypothetical protein